MPGRPSSASVGPATGRRRKAKHPAKPLKDVSPAAASPEPMIQRSSADEADRPRFVAPEEGPVKRRRHPPARR